MIKSVEEFTQATIDALQVEAVSARSKFPNNKHLFYALAEEVGELSTAILEGHPLEDVVAEAIQVAVVALRIAEEGDGGKE